LEEKNGMKISYFDMPVTSIRCIQGEIEIDKSPKEVIIKFLKVLI